MKFKCPYCGKVKDMGAFGILHRWLFQRELRIWCDRCFYSTHWHLKLWRRTYVKKEARQARLEKKQ